MKTICVEVKLYNFDELSEKAKITAIMDERNFLIESLGQTDFDNPKDYEQAITDYNRKDELVIECIKENDYFFYDNGEMANVTDAYHENIKKFNFHGVEYLFQ